MSNQVQHYSNCNHEGREEDLQPRCRLYEGGEHKEQNTQDEIPTTQGYSLGLYPLREKLPTN
jgi:hypothetical protein